MSAIAARAVLLIGACLSCMGSHAQVHTFQSRSLAMPDRHVPGEYSVRLLTQLWGDPLDEVRLDPALRTDMVALRQGSLRKLAERGRDEAGWIARSESGGRYDESGQRSAARVMNWVAMAMFTLPLEHRITLARAAMGMMTSAPYCGLLGWHGVAWAEVGDELARFGDTDRKALVSAWHALLTAAATIETLPQPPTQTLVQRVRESGTTPPQELAAALADLDVGDVLTSRHERALNCALAEWWWTQTEKLPPAAQAVEVDAICERPVIPS